MVAGGAQTPRSSRHHLSSEGAGTSLPPWALDFGRMRSLAAGCLVGVALVITGCGTSNNAGKVAVNTIEDDWEGFYIASSDPFPSRPDLKGQDTIRSIHCGIFLRSTG